MLSLPTHSKLNNSYVKDAIYTVLFGMLSVVFSRVQFHIPEVGNSNLREMPLLISLFHISNPVFLIGLSLFTLIGAPSQIPDWIVVSVHLVPLFIAFRSFKWLENRDLPDLVFGIVWMIMAGIYYLAFLIPLVVISIKREKIFLESYQSILPSIWFEMIASALVSGLYLIQLEIRKTLQLNNKNLEKMVDRRTLELTVVNDELQRLNKELLSSNDEIKELNENLEKIVKERTEKINDQLGQLMRYAHMNSHEVRAPLARMLGLLQLIKREDDEEQMRELLDMLYNSSIELDVVIKEMNRLLEKEVELSEEVKA